MLDPFRFTSHVEKSRATQRADLMKWTQIQPDSGLLMGLLTQGSHITSKCHMGTLRKLDWAFVPSIDICAQCLRHGDPCGISPSNDVAICGQCCKCCFSGLDGHYRVPAFNATARVAAKLWIPTDDGMIRSYGCVPRSCGISQESATSCFHPRPPPKAFPQRESLFRLIQLVAEGCGPLQT